MTPTERATLTALVERWRQEDPDDVAWSAGRLQCADELSAALAAHTQGEATTETEKGWALKRITGPGFRHFSTIGGPDISASHTPLYPTEDVAHGANYGIHDMYQPVFVSRTITVTQPATAPREGATK